MMNSNDKSAILEERILNMACKLFCSYGIKSVTMDDLAESLSISKKTIYSIYKDKSDLLEKVIHKSLQEREAKLRQFEDEKLNPVKEMLLIIDYFSSYLKSVNHSMFYDLQKLYPELWLFIRSKDEEIENKIKTMISQGIDQELFRSDIDVDIISYSRIIQINNVFNPLLYPPDRFNITDVLNQLTKQFLYGILSEKGFKFLKDENYIY